MSRIAVLFSLLLLSAPTRANPFPTPTGMSANVQFWLRVYSEWPTNRYAIHDDVQLDVVYRVIAANDGREPKVKNAKSEVEAALARLDERRPTSEAGLSGVDLEVFRAHSRSKDPARFARARGHVRHQKGQRDRFAKALKVSGRYRSQIEAVLADHGLPKELMALVFVESMFDVNARSYSGALGIWQFMRATGREYLNINKVVDERRDPILASYAASSYLRSAHKRLGAWPVAITSYNYGMNGMARAIKAVGTRDLATILGSYRSGRLGFAAKNYYCEFLAALMVMQNPGKYFPSVKLYPAWRYDVVRLPAPTTVPELARAGVAKSDELRSLNPALSREALRGKVPLPQGMSLRLPRGAGSAFLTAFARIPASKRRPSSARDRVYTVKAGDNVTAIARRHGVTTGQVLAANHLARDRAIHPGMQLKIPPRSTSTTLLPEARRMEIPPAPPGGRLAKADPVVDSTSDSAVEKPKTRVVTSTYKSPAATRRERVRAAKEKTKKLPPPLIRRARVRGGRVMIVAGPAIANRSPLALEREIGVDVVVGALPLPAIDIVVGAPAGPPITTATREGDA